MSSTDLCPDLFKLTRERNLSYDFQVYVDRERDRYFKAIGFSLFSWEKEKTNTIKKIWTYFDLKKVYKRKGLFYITLFRSKIEAEIKNKSLVCTYTITKERYGFRSPKSFAVSIFELKLYEI